MVMLCSECTFRCVQHDLAVLRMVTDGKFSRFIPMLTSTGSIVIDGAIVDAKGEATFIHAIQGMKPYNVSVSLYYSAIELIKCTRSLRGGTLVSSQVVVRTRKVNSEVLEPFRWSLRPR